MIDELSRRHALQTMAAGGLTFWLPGLTAKAASKRSSERPKSLITLFMAGGMSQLETWDPHPHTSGGGDVKAISTSLSGLEISEFLPQMAEQMHEVTTIRSLTSMEGDHARGASFVKTGYRLDPTLQYPSLGAIAAHQLPCPELEIPAHICMGTDSAFPRGGYLGNQFDAFRVFNPGSSVTNLKSEVSVLRQDKRTQALDLMSRRFAANRPGAMKETMHADTVDRAFKMMSSEQLRAFEIDKVPAEVKAAYGDSRFGRGCLVARQLVETGVRSVEVSLNGFDTHVNNHEGQKTQADILDPAFSTLLQDLRDRDLLDSTVVLCITEFGRTPEVNAAGGRDHWPHWFSCVVAGGGFRKGLVVGETSGEKPRSMKPKPKPQNPVSIPELYATILKTMGINDQEEIMTAVGRPIRLADAEAKSQLLLEKI